MKLSRHLQLLRKQKQALRSFKIAALLALTTASAQAANYYWDPTMTGTGTGSGGTGNWDTTDTFWLLQGTGDTVWPNTTANTADFATTARTVTLTSNIVAGGLIFDTAGYTIAAGAYTLSLDASGIVANPATGTTTISGTGGVILTAAQTWTTATGGTLAVSAPIANGGFTLTTAGAGSANLTNVLSGTGGLTINSTGVTTLSGNNTYSGTSGIGANNALQISAAATATYGATGAVTNNGTLYLSPATGMTLTYGAAIGGAGVLNQFGAGTTSLTGANTYSGATTLTRGLLQFNAANTFSQNTTAVTVASGSGINFLGDSTNVTVPATTAITLNGSGVSTLGNASRGAINVQGNTKTVTINAPITLGSASAIGQFGIGPVLTLNGVISGAFQLTFNPDGGGGGSTNYNLNAANTFSGGVALQTGAGDTATYMLGNAAGLGATTNVVTFNPQNGSYVLALQLNALSPTVGGLNQTANTGNANEVQIINDSTTTASTLTVNVSNGGSYNYRGSLGGTGTGNNNFILIKSGAGTQILSSNSTTLNTFTGTTSVQAGVLNVDSTVGTPLGSSVVTVSSGANLTFQDHAGGVASIPNNLTLNGSGISGSGALNYFNSGFATTGTGMTGTVNLASDTTVRVDANTQTAPISFRGVISGVGGLTFFDQTSAGGTALVQLNAANTYGTTNENTLLTSSATGASPFLVELAVTNALPTATTLTIGGTPAGATGTFNKNVTVQLDGISQTVAGLAVGVASANTGGYSIVGNSATLSTLTVNNAVANTFSGAIGTATGNTANLALVKSGAGMLTLTGGNAYTGGTTINGGTLAIGSSTGLGTGNVIVAANSQLNINAGIVITNMTGTTLTLTDLNTSIVDLLGTAGTVQDTVATLIVNGTTETPGTYGAMGSGAANVLADFAGTGELMVGTVPEPSTWIGGLGSLALMGWTLLRRRTRPA